MGRIKGSWGADGSLDVLLAWLLTPGNYKVWFRGSGTARSKVLRDVQAELEKGGIRRSESSIRGKLRLLETKCASTLAWMKKKGVEGEDDLRCVVGTDVETKLQKICPHYRDLMPIFRALGFEEKRVPDGKRRAIEKRQETKKKRRTEPSVTKARPVRPKVIVCEKRSIRHNAAGSWYQERALMLQAPFKFEPSTKFCENLEKEQLNLTRELNKGVVSTEKKRHDQERETQKELEKLAVAERAVLTRHNLKKMGVLDDEIERGIPLPEP